jgi:tetratricopeptide (TPR) repeat protein
MRHKTVAQLVCIAVALGVLCAGCSRDGKIALAKQYIYAGNSYLAYRKLDKALAEFEKALAIAPRRAKPSCFALDDRDATRGIGAH